MGSRLIRRAAGVLCPVSTLPGPFGIGDLGPQAEKFIDWLKLAGHRYWQTLPMALPDGYGSPYSSSSSLAGNWLLTSPEVLQRDGLITRREVQAARMAGTTVQYKQVSQVKRRLLRQAWKRLPENPRLLKSFQSYHRRELKWLKPVTEYFALKELHQNRPWWRWPEAARRHGRVPAGRQARFQRLVEEQIFRQWAVDRQWRALYAYAAKRGITIISDVAFFVPLDSADVWRHPELFELDRHGQPTHVAGTPPDDFAKQGQRWGNPVYRWPAHQRTKFAWWLQRLERAARFSGMVRLDHFRGLIATWHIPVRAKTTASGHWAAGPGARFLRIIRRRWPGLKLIAEDLGVNTPAVEKLRRQFDCYGTRIFLFGWSGLRNNIHHPRHLRSDSVYYSSNHDTPSVRSWWQQEAKWYERHHLREYCASPDPLGDDTAWKALYQAPSRLVITNIQDILNVTARLNRPGTKRGNWRWRMGVGLLDRPLARHWKKLAVQSDRVQ